MQNKNKEYKKVIDLILERKDEQAKAELQKIIKQHPKYISYREQLSEMGLDLRTATIDEKTYTDIQEVLKKYPVPVRLAILDETWKLIKNEN